jgi:hypothetical protein
MRVSETPRNALVALGQSVGHWQTPDDSAECRFLGRAYHDIAKQMFPEWTGKELALNLPDLLPDAIEYHPTLLSNGAEDDKNVPAEWYEPPRRATLEYAYDLLHAYQPELRPKPRLAMGMFGGFSLAPPKFTLQEWEIAQEINKAHHEIVRQGMLRRRRVDKAICELCEAGILRTRLRRPEGGEFSPVLPPAYWRTENYGERFISWRMSPLNPFSTYGELHFVFVEKSSLAVALARPGAGSAYTPQAMSGFVSDQMQFLLCIARKCEISAEDPLTIEAIKAQILEDWPWEKGPGKTELNYMASIVRNRDARDEAWKRKQSTRVKPSRQEGA